MELTRGSDPRIVASKEALSRRKGSGNPGRMVSWITRSIKED